MVPDWLVQKIASCPKTGAGVHAWMFSLARQLHAHMDSAAIEAVLTAATANCGRRVTAREIRDAVNNSHAVRWQPQPKSVAGYPATRSMGNPIDAPAQERWPKCDPGMRAFQVGEANGAGVYGLYDLWERSPVRLHDSFTWTTDDWLDWLFPNAEWLCLAKDHAATARSRRREKWTFGPADECGLVVPSPMTGPSGKTQDGERSHRCLDNTGPRRWLVIEFDKLEDKKTNMPIDEQAALHWHFRGAAAAVGWPPLRLVVHSGSRSLHGWYGPVTNEELAYELMYYTVSLGADPATWNRCQLVRLPGGQRAAKPAEANIPDGWPEPGAQARQEVFFFDPTHELTQCAISPHQPHSNP